jgi:phospholipid/cholesterol/gamma-HCH transport system permease protein
MGWVQYQNACLRSIRLEDVTPALLKTLVFGWLIGTVGCYCGLTAEGGTEGVGRAATRGVVASILLVLASNVFLVGVIQATERLWMPG